MKTLIIAESTAMQTRRQPVLYIIVGLSACLIFMLKYITQFTFGYSEQLNMMRQMGVSTITMSGLLYTVFASALAVTEDLERRSAITLLCKPVHRHEYILGKFLGISFTIILVYIVLTAALLFTLRMTYNEVYESRLAFSEFFQKEAVPIFKGVILSYFMILLLNSVSLAIATRLPLVPNLAICVFFFLAGNLTGSVYKLVVRGATKEPQYLETLSWFRTLIEYPLVAITKVFCILIPNLEFFNITSDVAYGQFVSPKYVFLTIIYGMVYTTIALIAALKSFEHRELL